MASNDENSQHVVDLVKDARICMLTTCDADGTLVSRPMGLQETEFDGDLWFFADDGSHKAMEIGANPAVNVSFADSKGSSWTSISGSAQIVRDRQKTADLWSAPLKAWFPDGPETPGLILIKVHADSAEYWEGPGSKVVQLLGMARAAVSKDPDKFPGDNATVNL